MIVWHLAAADVRREMPTDWLTGGERTTLASLVVPKRRADWLLGRLAAKHLVLHVLLEHHDLLLSRLDVEIASRPSGVPFARLAAEARPVRGYAPGDAFPFALSISHSSGQALAAVTEGVDAASLGADVELLAPRSPELVSDFFTDEEAALAATSPDAASAVWSAKESVLKALGLGLTVDTRSVCCLPPDGGPLHLTAVWEPFAVELSRELAGRPVRVAGRWRRFRDLVLTLAYVVPKDEGRTRDLDRELHAEAA